MKTYSVDRRERLLGAIDAGLGVGEAAALVGVGPATTRRWRQRQRLTGSVRPRPKPGRPPKLARTEDAALTAQVTAQPDATLAEHCETWATQHGGRVSPATLCRRVQRLGLPLKKTVIARERDEGVRATWRTTHAALDPATRVLLDEPSPHTAMTRRCGRAARGERVQSSVPRNHGPNVTLLATLTPGGIEAPSVQDGAVDRDVFTADVEQVLVLTLRPGQTVLMDNLNGHTGQQMRRAIEAVGGQLVFLPTYSPDFNPIDPASTKIKTALRRAAARTFEKLVEASREAIDAITAADAHNFVRHGGDHLDDRRERGPT